MSASDSRSTGATARLVIASLERYEQELDNLLRGWPAALNAYDRVSESVESVRRPCSGMPALAVPAVAFLIAHAELVHFLWGRGRSGRSVDELHDAILRTTKDLRTRAEWLILSEGDTPPRSFS